LFPHVLSKLSKQNVAMGILNTFCEIAMEINKFTSSKVLKQT